MSIIGCILGKFSQISSSVSSLSRDGMSQTPKSQLLWFIIWIEEFLKNHCMACLKSIESRSTWSSFLDDYSARWQAYTSLIEVFETEFDFVEILVNEIYITKSIREQLGPDVLVSGKFSFLKMMSRIWALCVLKNLFDNFTENVQSILLEYQKTLLGLASDYKELKASKKYFQNYIDNKYSLKVVDSQVFRQSMQMVLDLSINEYSVAEIGNSLLPINVFYPKLEDRIMDDTKEFIKDLLDSVNTETLKSISQIYFKNLSKVLISRTQRRLHNLIYTTIWIWTENKIMVMWKQISFWFIIFFKNLSFSLCFLVAIFASISSYILGFKLLI